MRPRSIRRLHRVDGRQAPQVEVILIDRPDQPLLGAGEAATAPVAAALANAVFDATGVRLRTVPFTQARVKAALASERKATAALL
jgi:CO/xanthine dehydrogenase Mo-binding subunit